MTPANTTGQGLIFMSELVDMETSRLQAVRRISPRPAGTKVLLVEDSLIDARLIQTLLRDQQRFTISCVETLASALSALRTESPDVLILDLNLPDESGLNTFATVHDHFPNIPIVILSGNEDADLAREAVSLGAQDYIPKRAIDGALLERSLAYAVERQGRQLAEQRNLVIEQDLAYARQIQQRLLPRQAPKVEGFDIAGICQPADACGGDFFDFIPIPKSHPPHGHLISKSDQIELRNGMLDLVVADVSSHGFAPALTMVGTRRMLRACARMHSDVGRILHETNWAVYEDTLEGQFVAAFYARLDPANRSVSYAGAGHPAWVISRNGEVRALPYSGIPLGLFNEREYQTEGGFFLEPGEMLLSMTDGAWEAGPSDEEWYGQQRVFDAIQAHRDRPAKEILDRLVQGIRDFSAPHRLLDDVTLLLVKVTE